MKWIAKRDFYRTPELADVEIIDGCKGAPKLVKSETEDSPLNGKNVSPLHDNHIHRGAIFELGTSKDESELRTRNDPKRKLIAQLRYAGCISDASDKDCVKRIEEDIATDIKRDATVAKANKTTVNSDLVESLIAAMSFKAAPSLNAKDETKKT